MKLLPKQLQLNLNNHNSKGSHVWVDCSFEVWNQLSHLAEPCYATLTHIEDGRLGVESVSIEKGNKSYFIVARSN